MTIEIQTSPRPPGRRALSGKTAELREAINSLKPGTDEYFVWPENRGPYKAAYSLGFTIATRKTDGGYKVWRVS